MKKFLGNFSPAYGIMTGEGEMGKMAKKGMMGLLPRMIAQGATQEEEEEMKRAQAEGRAMKKGGKVKKYQDGGVVANSNYPFGQGQTPAAMPDTSSSGLGNNSPLVQVNAGAADTGQVVEQPVAEKPFGMK